MRKSVHFGVACVVTVAACADTYGLVSEEGVTTPASLQSTAGEKPQFGATVLRQAAPPPIAGGTLVIAQDGRTAIATDPDRDAVYVVDLAAQAVRHAVRLPAGSEPGRVVVDDEGRAHVVLRSAGGVAVIDLALGSFVVRSTCLAPRGLAFDRKARAVIVGCAEGELVSLGVDDGAIRSRVPIDRDVRDVLGPLADGTLRVSTFRSARLFNLRRGVAPELENENGAVAWRAIATPPDGEPAVVSQDPSPAPIPAPVNEQHVYYGGIVKTTGPLEPECSASSILMTRLTVAGAGSVVLPTAVLPVDLASNGRELAVVAAGNAFTPGRPQIYVLSKGLIAERDGGCAPAVHGNVPGQATAAAFDGDDALIVQTREPAALHIMTPDRRRPYKTIALSTESRFDTGHAIFHSSTGSFVACASCHAEGGDDGRTWEFSGVGLRRTPRLAGTLAGTAPYHWAGDMRDMRALVDQVFVGRMRGPDLDTEQADALEGWLFKLPAPPPLRSPSVESETGRVTFERRCASCHSGPRFTSNQTFDVGTGGKFQVPSLVGVGWRAPFLHDGCAPTLEARFTCGKRRHGDEGLTQDEIGQLTRYLETL